MNNEEADFLRMVNGAFGDAVIRIGVVYKLLEEEATPHMVADRHSDQAEKVLALWEADGMTNIDRLGAMVILMAALTKTWQDQMLDEGVEP